MHGLKDAILRGGVFCFSGQIATVAVWNALKLNRFHERNGPTRRISKEQLFLRKSCAESLSRTTLIVKTV
jgi:hypothetical protein